ncbi:hypothetical protein [Flavisolibacter tropicus]|uniref:TonB-dependent receptor plug domain-containing protein n=1 Tax=Flavisolibacter tropicus TaxID=1492898 RepID=A0A172TXA4_9BACT|nr:hypothetical protein [Flavisolibacter tropicus]ANE51622.1 hypothetical protein SY85_15040 [Flavisolibacter tropicus]
MKLTKNLLPFLVLGLFYSLPAASQKLIETLDTYNTSFVQEKMYVHFDKPVYSSGETIWFKAYLLNSNSSLSTSTNFYAELLNEEGTVVERKVYPIFESSATGSFDIPQQTKSNHLLFRAYTTWMLNFDTAFLFTKPINILHPVPQAKEIQQTTTQLRFFPEGGNWVTGLPAVLAFKATDNNGLPKTISGVIKNTAGKVITAFNSMHDGMGKVSLDPLPNDAYYAEWKDENNQVQKTTLPAQEKTGLALVITPTASHIGFTLTRTEGEQLKKVQVVAQMFNQVAYRANINFKESQVSGAIPVNKLVSGILQLTVFDSDWKPLAERIVFINKNDFEFSSAVNLLDKNLGKRGKNSIEIEVPDTLKTNLSLSITDAGLLAGNMEENIISQLMLTSDLRGYIHDPAYYFSSSADSVREHLDLVMLTNGWRRYNWEQLAQGILPTIKFPRENHLSLQGNIYGVDGSKISDMTQLNLFIQAKDSSHQFLIAPVDKTGRFAVNGLLFFDTVKVFYQFNKDARLDRKATVKFDPNTFRKDIEVPWNPSFRFFNNSIYSTERNQFFAVKQNEVLPLYDKKVKTLKEVVVKTKVKSREEELEKRYASGLFQTGHARSFNIVDDPFAISSMNVLNYLQSRVAGLLISFSGGSYTVTRRGDAPALFIDEMQVDMDQLASLPMSDVAYVKVIDPPFIGAMGNGPGGAISVYTRRGGDAKSTAKGLEQRLLTGYNMLKQFYSPDYATFNPLHEIEDVRSTLYWAPYILTDKTNKKIKIEFYNNDVSQSLRIVLEGLNEIGQVTRVEKVIQ